MSILQFLVPLSLLIHSIAATLPQCTVEDFDGRIFHLDNVGAQGFEMDFVLEHTFENMGKRLYVVDPCKPTNFVPSQYKNLIQKPCDPPGNMNEYCLQTGSCLNSYAAGSQPPSYQMSQGFIWTEMHSVWNATSSQDSLLPLALTSGTASDSTQVVPATWRKQQAVAQKRARGVGTCFNLMCGRSEGLSGHAFFLSTSQEYGWVGVRTEKLCAPCQLKVGGHSVDLRQMPHARLTLQPKYADGTKAGPLMDVGVSLCEVSLGAPPGHWNDFPGNINFFKVGGTGAESGVQLALWSNHQPMIWNYIGGESRRAVSVLEQSHPAAASQNVTVIIECPSATSAFGQNRSDISLQANDYVVQTSSNGKIKGYELKFYTNLICSLPERSSSAAPHNSKTTTWVIVGIAGGCIVVGITVVAIVLIKRHQLNQAANQHNDTASLITAINSDREDQPVAARAGAPKKSAFTRPVVTVDGEDYYVFSDHRPIGRGTFGAVYKGERVRDRLPIAVKHVAATIQQQQIYRQSMVTTTRFSSGDEKKPRNAKDVDDEARSLRLLPPHAHLIDILGIMTWDSTGYDRKAAHNNHPLLRESCLLIITPLLVCGDLHRFIKNSGNIAKISTGAEISPSVTPRIVGRKGLHPQTVLRFGAELCDVVAHLHENLVVHRDIKPENILLYEEKRGSDKPPQLHISLTDFGLARVMDSSMQTLSTQTGTPAFVAPECFSGKYKHSADLFSVGCVLYAMATGRTGRDAKDFSQGDASCSEGFMVSDAGLSEKFVALLRSLLSREPDERPTAAQTKQRLDELLDIHENYGSELPAVDNEDE